MITRWVPISDAANYEVSDRGEVRRVTLAAVFMIECAADWNSPISWRRIEGVLLLFAAIGGLIGRAVIP
jgi:hypothetical protein